jgi:hypothetical protein
MLSYAPPVKVPTAIVGTNEPTQSEISQTVYFSQLKKETKSTESSHYLSDRRTIDYFSFALSALLTTETNWNSYGAAPPTAAAIDYARSVLAILGTRLLAPSRILPSADGGVSLIFSSERPTRAVIECLNDGEHLLVLYDLAGRVETFEWPTDQLKSQVALVDKLKSHLRSNGLATSSQPS